MIISKLISGLGNQLFQYTIGRQISLKTKAHLKLDTSFFEGQSLRSFKLHHFNINAHFATEKEIERLLKIYSDNSLYSRLYRKAETYLPKNRKRYFKEREWWVHEPEVNKITSNVYLEGYWQHYKYYEKVHPVILEELTLKDTEEPHNYKIHSVVQQDLSSVSLHIRRTDYISDSDANNLMGVLPVEYYEKAIHYILQKVKQPCFYIFSDDLNWAKDNLKIKADVNYVDIENGTKDYLELDVMSKCRHNIIANSSFSWWGAFLNRNVDKIVIAPDNWVRPPEINKRIKLQFPSWIKI